MLNVDTCDKFLELLSKCDDCLIDVFGKTSVKKYNATGFFFQLFATGILEFELEGKNVIIVLGQDADNDYVYEHKIKWEGVIFKNRGTATGCSFGHFLLGDSYRWRPNLYETEDDKKKRRTRKKSNKK